MFKNSSETLIKNRNGKMVQMNKGQRILKALKLPEDMTFK